MGILGEFRENISQNKHMEKSIITQNELRRKTFSDSASWFDAENVMQTQPRNTSLPFPLSHLCALSHFLTLCNSSPVAELHSIVGSPCH